MVNSQATQPLAILVGNYSIFCQNLLTGAGVSKNMRTPGMAQLILISYSLRALALASTQSSLHFWLALKPVRSSLKNEVYGCHLMSVRDVLQQSSLLELNLWRRTMTLLPGVHFLSLFFSHESLGRWGGTCVCRFRHASKRGGFLVTIHLGNLFPPSSS